jgi:hypothetical protein
VRNVVQAIPEHAAFRRCKRLSRAKGDPDFPGSAAIGFESLLLLNLRVEGSIPSRLTTNTINNLPGKRRSSFHQICGLCADRNLRVIRSTASQLRPLSAHSQVARATKVRETALCNDVQRGAVFRSKEVLVNACHFEFDLSSAPDVQVRDGSDCQPARVADRRLKRT